MKENDNDLKVAVIRQELFELTGDYRQAIILNQFIYWTPRVNDHDLFLKEEQARLQNTEIELRNGWIYKTANDMAEETMLGLSPSNIRKYIVELVKSGWLQERNNPKHKWDRTLQYRLNTVKLKKDLLALGYVINIARKYTVSKIENGISETKTQGKQNRNAIPETTTETTPKITRKNIRECPEDTPERPLHYSEYAFTSDDKKEIVEYYMNTYKKYMGNSHPRLKPSQWQRVDNGLDSCIDRDNEFTEIKVYEWKNMIDQHFATDYKDCDYNILHFISDGIKLRRMYEAT